MNRKNKNITILNDIRYIEDFNLKYDKNLMYFELENPEKKEQDFISNEIEKINSVETEKLRKWNLSNNEFCNELRSDKRFENKFKDSDLTDSELKEHHFFIEQRSIYKPSEFENYRLTLYKQRLNNLPKQTL